MHNQRLQDALKRSGRRSEPSSFLARRSGMCRSKSRLRLAVSRKDLSVFERLRACGLAFAVAFCVFSVFGNWFHESLHRHCEHSADAAFMAYGAYGESWPAVHEADAHGAFDCPICRFITHSRFFTWFAATSSFCVVACYFLRAATRAVAIRRVYVNSGRAPPQLLFS